MPQSILRPNSRLLLSVCLSLLLFLSAISADQDQINYGQLPDFKFYNSAQQEITNQSFDQQYLLINFFFTSCPAVCPAVNGRIATLYQQQLPQLSFMSVSVDPTADTYAELSKYRKKFGVDDERWQFVRNDQQFVNKLIEDIKLVATVDVSMHTTRMVLVDPSGTIIGFYRGLDTEDFTELQKDLGRLTKIPAIKQTKP